MSGLRLRRDHRAATAREARGRGLSQSRGRRGYATQTVGDTLEATILPPDLQTKVQERCAAIHIALRQGDEGRMIDRLTHVTIIVEVASQGTVPAVVLMGPNGEMTSGTRGSTTSTAG